VKVTIFLEFRKRLKEKEGPRYKYTIRNIKKHNFIYLFINQK